MNMQPIVEAKANANIPDITAGDTVRVSARISEGGKERIQVFQGVVIKVSRGSTGASFTVRHVFHGVGVERTFPVHSPLVEKVEVVRHGKVRRAKLYYLRGLSGKAARKKVKRVDVSVSKKKAGEALAEIAPEEVLEEPMAEQLQEPALAEQTEEQLPQAAAEEQQPEQELKEEQPEGQLTEPSPAEPEKKEDSAAAES